MAQGSSKTEGMGRRDPNGSDGQLRIINVMLNYAMTADGSDSPPFLSYLVIHEAGSEPVSCDSWIRGQSGTLRAPLIVIEQISPA